MKRYYDFKDIMDFLGIPRTAFVDLNINDEIGDAYEQRNEPSTVTDLAEIWEHGCDNENVTIPYSMETHVIAKFLVISIWMTDNDMDYTRIHIRNMTLIMDILNNRYSYFYDINNIVNELEKNWLR